MKQLLKLSEYEKKTGRSPILTKRLIKEGKLKGYQDGPGTHWLVEYESNDEVSELMPIILALSQKVDRLSRHLGIQPDQLERESDLRRRTERYT